MTRSGSLILSITLAAAVLTERPGRADPSAAPALAPTSAPAVWVVEKSTPSEDLSAPGVVWMLSKNGMAFVREGKLLRQVVCKTRALAQGDTVYDCAGTQFVVAKPVQGKTHVRTARLDVMLRTATSAEAARTLKLVAADHAAAPEVCTRARHCCAEAMPLMGGTCDADSLPREENVTECEQALTSYRSLLQATGKSAPKSCEGR